MATTITTSMDATDGASSRLARLEAWLERVGERLNPILVRECRQALKSRQFSITFALVLFCCWAWTAWGVVVYGESLRFGGGGAGLELFYGYYCILAFALLLIVPYVSFRSLADERDDQTFELVTITNLRPRQIVTGKLGSALVQMMIYVSAVTPCLAFTYLLRGVEAPLILYMLAAAVLASLGLSTIGLLVATLTQEKILQTLLSALLVIGLLAAFIGALVWSYAAIVVSRLLSFDEPVFWYLSFALAAVYASYVVLLYFAAAANLTFASENRSTPLRTVMVGQQLLMAFIFGSAALLIREPVPEDLAIKLAGTGAMYLFAMTLHWSVMGIFLTTESPELSNRAKRRLPSSLVGRALFTWFSPGSATGYVFAVANLAAVWLMVVAVGFVADNWIFVRGAGRVSQQMRGFYAIVTIIPAYVPFYLGLGRLVIGLVRKLWTFGTFLGVVVQVALFIAGCLAPSVIVAAFGIRLYGYSLLYITNPFVTVIEIGRRSSFEDFGGVATSMVLVGAGVMFVLNLPAVAAELRRVRTPKPQRVQEDDAALKVKPIVVGPRNPWE